MASLCMFGHCGNNIYWIKKNGDSWFHFSCLNQEFQRLHIILACQILTSIQWLSCYNDYDLVIRCWPSKDDLLTNLVFYRFQLLSIPKIFLFLCWLFSGTKPILPTLRRRDQTKWTPNQYLFSLCSSFNWKSTLFLCVCFKIKFVNFVCFYFFFNFVSTVRVRRGLLLHYGLWSNILSFFL